jgi:N-methylhydantoinase A
MKLSIWAYSAKNFTHLFIYDNDSDRKNYFKTASDISGQKDYGFLNALKIASDNYKISLKEMLGITNSIVYNSTIAFDALNKAKTAKNALICTKGFRDILTLLGFKSSPYEFRLDYPEPIISRHLTIEINERITENGDIFKPLDNNELMEIVDKLKEEEVDSVAVCLLWSISNNAHEKKVAKVLKEQLANCEISVSHQVYPFIREDVRTLATAIDASVCKETKCVIKNLAKILAKEGYVGNIECLDYRGDKRKLKEVIEKPSLFLAQSVGGLKIAKDAMAVREGLLLVDMEDLDPEIVSIIFEYRFDLPKMNILNVAPLGAGDNSFACINKLGLLHVGSGAKKPACFMGGGEEVTITDVLLVLGYLDQDYFSKGNIDIDVDIAKKIIHDKISIKMNVSEEEAAYGIYSIACSNIVTGIRDLASGKGLNLEKVTLVGGCDMFGFFVGFVMKKMGVTEALLPYALGKINIESEEANIDIASEFKREMLFSSTDMDIDKINEMLSEMRKEADKLFDEKNVNHDRRQYKYITDVRYPNQVNCIEVVLDSNKIDKDAIGRIREEYHRIHKKRYYVCDKNEEIEILRWKLFASSTSDENIGSHAAKDVDGNGDMAEKETRAIFINNQVLDVKVYDADMLKVGDSVFGLCIVDSLFSPVLVPEDCVLTVEKEGYYRISVI